MRRRILLPAWLLPLLLALASPAAARPRVALVLSGGGARGIAHIGVLQVLEELHVPVDLVIGTSMGAIVGGLYAAGYGPAELEQIVTELDWPDAFEDSPPRQDLSFRRKEDDQGYLSPLRLGVKNGGIAVPRGIIQGERLNLVLRRLLLHAYRVRDFDRLHLPFRCVATDIVTGEEVVQSSGDLATALRSSMSIPAAFEPVPVGGRLLVDGFVTNNIPIDLAQQLGAEVVIAVNVGEGLLSRDEITSPIAVMSQALSILTEKATAEQISRLRAQDLLLAPGLEGFGAADFEVADQIIPRGRTEAERLAPRLSELSVDDEAWSAYLAKQRRGPFRPPVIDSIRVENDSGLSNSLMESRLETRVGERLDVDALEQDLGDIYGLDAFSRVDYSVNDVAGHDELLIEAKEKPWGPRYLRVGVRIEENFDQTSTYGIGVGYTVRPLNELGGEWRTQVEFGDTIRAFTELWQPIESATRYFFAPSLEFLRQRFPVYDGDEQRGVFSERTLTAGLDVGRQLGNWGEVRLGIRYSDGNVRPRIGPSVFDGSNATVGGIYLRLGVDTLDDVSFPRQGRFARATLASVQSGLGADGDFELAELRFASAWSFGENTVLVTARAASAFDGPLEVVGTDVFRAGGLFNLSGLDRDQLAGRNVGTLHLFGYRQIANPGVLNFTFPMYVGVTLETGNAWRDQGDISLRSLLWAGSAFLGFKTPIGPLYLAYGYAEGGRDSTYLFIGRAF